MSGRRDTGALTVRHRATVTKIDAATGRIDEVVEIDSDAAVPPRVLIRRPGADPETYASGGNELVSMIFSESGHDGRVSYAAGETADVDIEHARRAFRLGHGWPAGAGGKRLTAAGAVAALGLRESAVRRLPPALRSRIPAAVGGDMGTTSKGGA